MAPQILALAASVSILALFVAYPIEMQTLLAVYLLVILKRCLWD